MRIKTLAITTAFLGGIYTAQAATLSTFNYAPASITNKSIPQFDSSRSFFNQLVSKFQLPQNPTIVSISSDPGRIASFVAEQQPNSKIISLFPSSDFRTFAQQNYSTSQITFRQGDITEPQSSLHGQADVVFSSWTFNLIPKEDYTSTLENMRSTLKSGGYIAIITPAKGSTFTTAIHNIAGQPQWTNKLQGTSAGSFFTPRQFGRMMKTAGFTDVNTETTSYSTTFPTRQDLQNFIHTEVGQFLTHLDPKESEHFIRDVTNEYLRLVSATGNGPIPFSSKMLLATGQNPSDSTTKSRWP